MAMWVFVWRTEFGGGSRKKSLGKEKRASARKRRKNEVTVKASGAVSTQVCPNGGTRGPERMMGEFFGPRCVGDAHPDAGTAIAQVG